MNILSRTRCAFLGLQTKVFLPTLVIMAVGIMASTLIFYYYYKAQPGGYLRVAVPN